MKMKPKGSKSKDQIRAKRQRNLVAKNNKHKGGYHTPKKYVRDRYMIGDEWSF